MTRKQHVSTICLTDIDYFEKITARMPTDTELEKGWPANVPVLVMHKGGLAGDMAYRADLTEFTIDTTPAPDPEGTREDIRSVLYHVMEDLWNSLDDLGLLARATGRTSRDIARLARERRQWRTDEWDGSAALHRERYGPDEGAG
jgi:hypothetical protein